MAFSSQQSQAINITERTASVLSFIGCSFVIATFILSPRFRKPVNRLIFYAVFGNILYIIPGLIALDGIQAGSDSTLCQTQAFLIQATLPADALWNLAMALNVYATVFKHYDSSQLRAREPWYHLFNYGIPFFIALAYCFISTDRGKIYGNAAIWCWITSEWDFLRIATCYGPAWICIIVSFFIYIYAGREILRKRQQVQSFKGQRASSLPQGLASPSPFKTTEILVASELVDIEQSQRPSLEVVNSSNADVGPARIHTGGGHYSVTIASGYAGDRSTMTATSASRVHAVEVHSAAWRYTQCCILFFVSLLFTWVPSSVNRVHSLIYPTAAPSFGYAYAAAFVLPLTGFWNSLVYITTSWSACKALWVEDVAPALGIINHNPPALQWEMEPSSRPAQILSPRPLMSRQSQKTKSMGSAYEMGRLSPVNSLTNLASPNE